jgi:hypothetical protein
MQPGDGIAARTDAEPRDYGVYEAGQRGEEQRKAEPEGMALVLEVGLPNGPWVLEK